MQQQRRNHAEGGGGWGLEPWASKQTGTNLLLNADLGGERPDWIPQIFKP